MRAKTLFMALLKPGVSLLISLLITGPLCGVLEAANSKPNIVLILSDDFGWGSSGCYGAPSGLKTPNLDRLAREGRRFTQAYAPGSVCSPSRYGLMTGRYYWRSAVKDGKVIPANAALHIETNRVTLASVCKQAGYRTAAFGKWHLGLTHDRVTDWSKPLVPGPRQIGFDYFFGMAANPGSGPHSFIINEEVSGGIPGEPIVVQGGSRDGDTTTGIKKPWQVERIMESLTKEVCRWIQESHSSGEKPFFVYYAPNAVHEPIRPHPQFTGSPYGKYGDFIHELDWSVGQILNTLDELKLSQSTLVIFTSDNGGVVNPGNESASAALQAGLAVNGPLRGGKHSEFEGGFREPFLVRWPGKVPAGTVSDQVICLTDMPATFASLLGTTLPATAAEDSFDVSRAFTEKAADVPVRDHVILQSAHAIYTLRMGDWKLIERADAPDFASVRNKKKAEQAEKKKKTAATSRDELFNLKDDPAETKDVSASNTQRAAEMKKFLVNAREKGFTRPWSARIGK